MIEPWKPIPKSEWKNLKFCGVYIITNIVNKKWYVGSSRNIRARVLSHFSELRRNKHHNIYLQNAFNKDGEDNFVLIRAIKTVDRLQAYKLESAILNFAHPYSRNIGYNIDEDINIGKSCIFMSDETKNKIRNARLGSKASEETKRKMSEYRTGKKIHTQEFKEKMSIAFKGKARTKETVERMRRTNRERRGIKPEIERKICEMYLANVLIENIIVMCNVSSWSVYEVLKRNNIPRKRYKCH